MEKWYLPCTASFELILFDGLSRSKLSRRSTESSGSAQNISRIWRLGLGWNRPTRGWTIVLKYFSFVNSGHVAASGIPQLLQITSNWATSVEAWILFYYSSAESNHDARWYDSSNPLHVLMGSFKIWPTWLRAVRRFLNVFTWKSGFRWNNSAKIHPALHISTAEVYLSSPIRSSGGRYHKVITLFVYGRESSGSHILAKPKSPSLTRPDLVTKIFEHFRSRWRTLLAWQYRRPKRIWKNIAWKIYKKEYGWVSE